MSLWLLVLDFWTEVSDYVHRSTLSSLRERSVPAPYPACTERSLLKRPPRANAGPDGIDAAIRSHTAASQPCDWLATEHHSAGAQNASSTPPCSTVSHCDLNAICPPPAAVWVPFSTRNGGQNRIEKSCGESVC